MREVCRIASKKRRKQLLAMPLEKRRRILHRNGHLRPARALRLYETADYSAVLASIHQTPWPISDIPWRWLGGIVAASMMVVIQLTGIESPPPPSPPPSPSPAILALPKGARVWLYKSEGDARSSMAYGNAVAWSIGLPDGRPYRIVAERVGVIEAIDVSGRHVFMNVADIDDFKAAPKNEGASRRP